MPITPALSGAKMARDLGVTRDFLAPNVASASKIQQISSDRFLSRGLFNNNTGNVQQEQPWYDVQVPDWTQGHHVSQWSTLQYYLSSVAESNSLVPASANFISYFGFFPNGGGSSGVNAGGVLAPNGKIYIIPNDTDVVNVIIDPATLTVTTYAALGGAVNKRAYAGGSLAPNGRIYAAPFETTEFRFLDPATNTWSIYASVSQLLAGGGINDAFVGSVTAPNGKIYFIPRQSTMVYAVDPSNNSLQSFGTIISPAAGARNAYSGVLAPNGKIYTMPGTTSRVYVIDPSNNTVSSLATFFPSAVASANTSGGGVLAPNGKIYFGWGGGRRVYVLDPSNDSVETFGTFVGDYNNGALASDGRIYLLPAESPVSCIAVIDPEQKTISHLQTVVNTAGFNGYLNNTPYGLVMGNQGFLIGTNQNLIIYKPLNNQWNMNVLTNPFFNKAL